ncbi:MAG: hypothetical protein GY799_18640 [Desulfobulbaceae bacterium]|nr:hypothetical protein [Desulfobulbaceae bacterium]
MEANKLFQAMVVDKGSRKTTEEGPQTQSACTHISEVKAGPGMRRPKSLISLTTSKSSPAGNNTRHKVRSQTELKGSAATFKFRPSRSRASRTEGDCTTAERACCQRGWESVLGPPFGPRLLTRWPPRAAKQKHDMHHWPLEKAAGPTMTTETGEGGRERGGGRGEKGEERGEKGPESGNQTKYLWSEVFEG